MKSFDYNFVKKFIDMPINSVFNDSKVKEGRNNLLEAVISRDDYYQMHKEVSESRHIFIQHENKDVPELPVDTPISMPFGNCLIHADPIFKFTNNSELGLESMMIITDDHLNYTVYSFMSDFKYNIQHIIKKQFFYDENVWEDKLVRYIIQLLNKESLGELSFKQKLKIKTREGKKWFKTNKIVYCQPKRSSKTDGIAGQVNWKHSWEVRGHWRKTKRFGKDPSGRTINNGFTWVIPHVKGEGVLVRKIRSTD